jgi:predicted regulator of Ras-like GTPase activity (Roadblock/LC7/MglB family)
LAIPLNAIVSRFSTALQSAVARPPRASDFFALSLSAALQQLPAGSVKISFSDLKRGSTPGVFAAANQLDSTVIEIPLPEILSRLNPAYLTRRPQQRQVHVPENVGNVFASSQGPEVVSRIPEQLAVSHLAQSRDDLQASKILAGAQFGTALTLGTTSAAPTTLAPASPVAAPSGQRPAVRPQITPPVPAAASGQTSTDPQAPVKIALAALARHWPEPSRKEILSAHIAASVHIPYAELQGAMARGKAVFRWQQIRSWIVPPAPASPSHLDSIELDLPLSVLIPPFLARRPAENSGQKRIVTDEIPDVFLTQKQDMVSRSQPRAASITTSPTPLVMEPRLEALASAPHVEVRTTKPAAPAPAVIAALANPTSRGSVLPSEIVARACRLNGVAGALVATPDGLVVAGQVPPHQSIDSLAAVLPPVFNRLGQYMRDLKLGEVTQVELLLGKMPLQVFKLTHAYFAVLGKEAEGLPKGQLSVLASQLSAPSN